jgi:hypothetical protein
MACPRRTILVVLTNGINGLLGLVKIPVDTKQGFARLLATERGVPAHNKKDKTKKDQKT